MSTSLLILASFAGLALAVWWQLRTIGEGATELTRRRRQAGLGLAVFLLLLGLAHYVSIHGIPKRLFAAEEDGRWGAVSIDGQTMTSQGYTIVIEDGRVAGGRDGCNYWGFSDDPPAKDGSRMIVSTLVGCPEDDPTRRAYWALTTAEASLVMRQDGTLWIAAKGHRGAFRRCRSLANSDAAKSGGSGGETCVTHDSDRLVNF